MFNREKSLPINLPPQWQPVTAPPSPNYLRSCEYKGHEYGLNLNMDLMPHMFLWCLFWSFIFMNIQRRWSLECESCNFVCNEEVLVVLEDPLCSAAVIRLKYSSNSALFFKCKKCPLSLNHRRRDAVTDPSIVCGHYCSTDFVIKGVWSINSHWAFNSYQLFLMTNKQ